jgi:hypothetical protein
MSSLAPFLLGLVGESLTPLRDAGRATKDAFSAVGGDVARMVHPKRKRRGRRRQGLFRRLGNYVAASSEFVPRRVRKQLRRPFEALPNTQLGQAAIATKDAFAAVGGDVARMTGLDKQYRRATKALRPMRRRALKHIGNAFRSWQKGFAKSGPSRRRPAPQRPPGPRSVAQAAGGLFAANGHRDALSSTGWKDFGGATGAARGQGGRSQLGRIANDVHAIRGLMRLQSGPLSQKGHKDGEEHAGISGLLTKVGGTIGAIIGVLAGLIPATLKFGEVLSEKNREFAGYSGSLAASYQQADVSRFLVNIQHAHGIERSAAGVNTELTEFRKATEPLERMFTNLTNAFGVMWLQGATAYAKALTEVLQGWGVPQLIDEWLTWLGVQKDKKPAIDLIRDLSTALAKGGMGVNRSKPMPPV